MSNVGKKLTNEVRMTTAMENINQVFAETQKLRVYDQ